MSSIIVAIQLICIRQLGSLIERVSDKNSMERIDHFQDKTKVSDAVAGELYQGLATSFPEMSTMLVSIVFFGLNPVIGMAANIGSGVFQFMPVIAIPALLSPAPLHVDKYEVLRTTIFYGTILLVLAGAVRDGTLHWLEITGIIGYRGVFMRWSIRYRPRRRKKHGLHQQPHPDHHLEETPEEKKGVFTRITQWLPNKISHHIPHPHQSRGYLGPIPLGFIISLLLVGVSVYILVSIVESLGTQRGISLAFLSMTVLATITSLPELATNIPLAKKGKGDQIIGNAVGSNSIDIAISTCLMTLIAAMISGKGSFVIDDTQAILTSILLLTGIAFGFLLLLRLAGWKIGKTQAWILLGAYVIYVAINYFSFQ